MHFAILKITKPAHIGAFLMVDTKVVSMLTKLVELDKIVLVLVLVKLLLGVLVSDLAKMSLDVIPALLTLDVIMLGERLERILVILRLVFVVLVKVVLGLVVKVVLGLVVKVLLGPIIVILELELILAVELTVLVILVHAILK